MWAFVYVLLPHSSPSLFYLSNSLLGGIHLCHLHYCLYVFQHSQHSPGITLLLSSYATSSLFILIEFPDPF